MPASGAAVAELLAAGGVQRFYTVPGESFLEILDGVDAHPKIELVSTRHEGGAAFMALADATLTGRPAVVAGTRAVGGANLAIGVHTALQESLPMVVCLGQVETAFLGREAFQEVDVPAFFGPIAKHAVTVRRTDRIPELVADALRLATTGRPGPVVLAFPADVLGAEVDDAAQERALQVLAHPVTPPVADPAAVERLAEALRTARRPVVLAGAGARGARAELAAVAERFDLGVYAGFRRQDVFDNADSRYLGHIGLGGYPRWTAGLAEADLVLVVGCRLGEVTTAHYTLPSPSSRVAQIDLDPAVIGAILPAEIGIVADARQALAALLGTVGSPVEPRDWAADRIAYEEIAAVGPSRAQTGCDPAQVFAALAAAFSDDTVVANDAGNFSAFLHRHWRFRHGHTQVGVGNGAMGYGVPAAVGARFAEPGRPVVGVAGDGGFLMTGLEVETAVRHGLDLTVVVLRNGLHGTIAMHQARASGRLVGTRIGAVDIAGISRALGATATTVTDEGELADAFAAARADSGPTVVEVLTDPELIEPDHTLAELVARRR